MSDLTPLQAVRALTGQSGLVVLHSQRNDDGVGTRSFVSCRPVATLQVTGLTYELRQRDGTIVRGVSTSPLQLIEEFVRLHSWKPTAGPALSTAEPIPCVFGYLGYELGAQVEGVAPANDESATVPDAVLAAYDAVTVWAEAQAGPSVVGRDVKSVELLTQLISSPAGVVAALPATRFVLRPDQSDALHVARIERVLEYLRAGDAYQVNITRRWTALGEHDFTQRDVVDILDALQTVAPSPFGAVFEFATGAIISASPELFLSRRGAHIETRPIKGTRRRTGVAEKDAELAHELANAEKDGAEHLMIVDLQRNDLGRVCEVGSVLVPQLGYIVTLPHLLHKVSRVRGRLALNASLADILRSTFPGGSITGAPKVRAMQIISELEPVRRGPYCGALGWFGVDSFELAMAIRVGVLAAKTLTVHVGGGIVLDSNPQDELRETYDKIAGWQAALQLLHQSPTG